MQLGLSLSAVAVCVIGRKYRRYVAEKAMLPIGMLNFVINGSKWAGYSLPKGFPVAT
jgi:hypothetical protein|tara:strand:+ start:218 stop:388 length:171 start_codon:yes stop_codon:yes gene_type:complete